MADDIAPVDPPDAKAPSGHLVERMVQRLRGIGGLSASKLTEPEQAAAAPMEAEPVIADLDDDIEAPIEAEAEISIVSEDEATVIDAPVRPNVEAMGYQTLDLISKESVHCNSRCCDKHDCWLTRADIRFVIGARGRTLSDREALRSSTIGFQIDVN